MTDFVISAFRKNRVTGRTENGAFREHGFCYTRSQNGSDDSRFMQKVKTGRLQVFDFYIRLDFHFLRYIVVATCSRGRLKPLRVSE